MRTLVLLISTLAQVASAANCQIDELYGRVHQTRSPEQDPGWNLGHTRYIHGLDFSPDGRLIATASEDHTIRLWNARTGSLVRTIKTRYGTPFFCKFSPDGRAILAGFRERAIGLWATASGKEISVARLDAMGPLIAYWHPDGTRFMYASENRQVVIRARDLRIIKSIPTGFAYLSLAGFAPDGHSIVCIGFNQSYKDAKAFAIDERTGKRAHGWFDSQPFTSIQLSPDRRFAVAVSPDRKATIRNAVTGTTLSNLSDAQARNPVLFSSIGHRALIIGFVTQYSSNTARLLSSAAWKPVAPQFDAEYVGAAALAPDGLTVAFQDNQHENRFRLYDTRRGKVIWSSADPALILGSKPGLALAAELSHDWVDYGLPLPPNSARLAYVEERGPPRSEVKKPYRILALLDRPAQSKQKSKWYAGWLPIDVDEDIVKPIEPAEATLKNCVEPQTGLRYIGDSDVAMAVFCYRRGWNRLSLQFLARKLKDYRGNVREEFAGDAWTYWESFVAKPAGDRKTAARYLKLLFGRSPAIQSDHKKALLADLDLTIASHTSKQTGIDQEIDALVESADGASTGFGASGWDLDKVNPALRSLWLRGFDAVPVLLRHINDRRLARSGMDGMNRYPSHITRVGEIVSRLLFQLAGERRIKGDGSLTGELELANRDSAERWWAEASAIGEEKYLIEHIKPEENSSYVNQPNLHNATILARKYPRQLPLVFELLLKQYHNAGWLVDHLLTADLPESEKQRLLLQTVTTGGDDDRLSGFWGLVKIKYSKTLDLLIGFMDQLPAKTQRDFWLAVPGRIGPLIQEIDEPRGWDALEKLARRSVPGQRLEILHNLGYGEVTGLRLRHRIEFMARFLNDNTLVDFSKGGGFEGPHADGDLKRITVRDSVLRHVAYDVGVKGYPREEWTEQDWAAWRPEVLAALSKYLARPVN